MKSALTEAYWQSFQHATGSTAVDYVPVTFGDSPAMADELADLIRCGEKTASAGLQQSYTLENMPEPAVGDHVMVLDSRSRPVCIYVSSEVRIGPLNSVDEAFARDEGEGDRTRQWWLAAHSSFFSREAARLGFEMREDIQTVFERFTVVWPPEAAKAQSSR